MKRSWRGCIALAAVLASVVGGSAGASPRVPTDFISFSNDPAGAKPNDWMSSDSSIVSFSDSLGADLDLEDFGNQSHGLALQVLSDDQGYLIMRFTVPVCQLRLAFGNDDPGYSNDGDKARLRVFDGAGAVVAMKSVVMNRNDLMDQRIGLAAPVGSAGFLSADFFFAVTTGGLIEIVDNVNVTPC
jgi:hypothetical protein